MRKIEIAGLKICMCICIGFQINGRLKFEIVCSAETTENIFKSYFSFKTFNYVLIKILNIVINLLSIFVMLKTKNIGRT